jgi:hypothetical protein
VAVLIALVALVAGAPPAGAEEDRRRTWAGSAGAGAFGAFGGPSSTGLCAAAALYPGGWAGRFGLRLEARAGGADRDQGRLFTAGLAYETASARPRLALALHGEAGVVSPDPRAAVGGGVELELWLLGPVALAVDGSSHLAVDGLDSELILAASISLRLAR